MGAYEKINTSDAVVDYLNAQKGAFFCCQQIATQFGMTSSHAARMLTNLANAGRIMISLHKRDRTYYVPDPAKAASPAPSHTPLSTPPLKVDKHRIELYREMAEARAAIHSIG